MLRNDERNDTLYTISKGIKENFRIDYYNNKLSISGSYILLQNLFRLEGIKELNLAKMELKDPGMEYFCHIVTFLTSLRSLNLFHNCFSSKWLKRLISPFKYITNLERLNLSDNRIKIDGLKSLIKNFSYINHLKSLKLSNTHLLNKSIIIFSSYITILSELEELSLANNCITSKSIKHLCYCLSNIKTFTYLNLSRIPINDTEKEELADVRYICYFLSKLPKFKNVKIPVSKMESIYLLTDNNLIIKDFKSLFNLRYNAKVMNCILNEYNTNHNNDYFKLLINLFISGPTTSTTKETLMKKLDTNSVEYIILNKITQGGIQIDFSEIKTSKLLNSYIDLLDQLCKIKSYGVSNLGDNDSEMMEIVRQFHPNFNYPASYTFSCCTIPTTWFKDLLHCNYKLSTLWGIYMCCCRIKNIKYSSKDDEEEEQEDSDNDREYIPNGIGYLSSIFPYTIKLKNLILSMNNINDSDLKELSITISVLTNLNVFWIDLNQIGDEGVIELSKSIIRCTNLTNMNIGNNLIGDKGIECLCLALLKIKNFEVLNIENNYYTSNGVSYISYFISNHKSLEECNISKLVDGDKSVIQFTELIYNRIQLEKLSITNSNFTHIGMSNLCNSFIYMKLFELTLNNNNLSGMSMKCLSDSLSLLTSLELLSLSNCRINDSDVNNIIQSIPSIRRLNIFDLSKNVISDVGVGYISHSFHILSNLNKLKLNNNQITIAGLSILYESTTLLQSLTQISLYGNSINNNSLDDNIMSFILHYDSLYNYYVYFMNNISRYDDSLEFIYNIRNMYMNNHYVLKMICEEYVYSNNERIFNFLLHLCFIQPTLACPICVVLSLPTNSMKFKLINGIRLNNTLDMQYNELNDEDIRLLSVLISKLLEIKTINISNNNLTNKSVKYLCDITTKNKNINEIYIKNNKLEDLSIINQFKSEMKNVRIYV